MPAQKSAVPSRGIVVAAAKRAARISWFEAGPAEASWRIRPNPIGAHQFRWRATKNCASRVRQAWHGTKARTRRRRRGQVVQHQHRFPGSRARMGRVAFDDVRSHGKTAHSSAWAFSIGFEAAAAGGVPDILSAGGSPGAERAEAGRLIGACGIGAHMAAIAFSQWPRRDDCRRGGSGRRSEKSGLVEMNAGMKIEGSGKSADRRADRADQAPGRLAGGEGAFPPCARANTSARALEQPVEIAIVEHAQQARGPRRAARSSS